VSEPISLPIAGDVLLGKYRLDRVVGQGGMGVVFEATHQTIGQKVAVKVLRPHVAGSPRAGERFLREARAAGRLRSRHAVRIHDVDATAEGLPFLVLEWLEGHDLDLELEARGPLPIEEAVRFVREAGDAVAEAHEAGIVHRDLKPSNLFLATDRSGRRCVVLDFGISKLPEGTDPSITSTDASLGTPLYMSPEQIRSARDVDARSDVWALGVILYELLAGRPPFMGETVTSTAAAIVADTPGDLAFLRPEAPAELVAIVMRCLEKEPAKRFTDGAALLAALAPFGGRAPEPAIARDAPAIAPRDAAAGTQAQTASEWERSASRPPGAPRRRALLAIPLVLVLLAGGAAFGFRALRNTTAPSPEASAPPPAEARSIGQSAATATLPDATQAGEPATSASITQRTPAPGGAKRGSPRIAPTVPGSAPPGAASPAPPAAPATATTRPATSNPYLL
jgi:serine/threonine-protein kinase